MTELLSVGGLLSAFGLSSASGLNAYLPLLVAAILDRTGVVHLGDGYSTLSSWPIIGVLALLLVVDFVGDKVPAVDHVFHAAGLIISPIAGALAFASTTGAVQHLHPAVAMLIGAASGGTLQAARATIRPVSTIATAGVATPFLSAGEDATSGLLTALAFLVPIAVVVVLISVVVGWFRLRKRLIAALNKPMGLPRLRRST